MEVKVYTKANIIVDIRKDSYAHSVYYEPLIEAPHTYIIIQSHDGCSIHYIKSIYKMINNNKAICYNETVVKKLIEGYNKTYFNIPVYNQINNIKQDPPVKHKINTNDFRYRSIWELFSSFILGLQRK